MGSYTVNLDPHELGEVQTSPNWVICVVRFKQPNLFSRAQGASVDMDPSIVAAERPKLVIKTARSLVVSGGKRSHVKNMQASLYPDRDYLAEIMPGDWVFAWMVNDPGDFEDLLSRIDQEQPCNLWQDGLKFVGRARAIGKGLSQAKGGTKTVSYSLQATGFGEFDTSIFWDPYLSKAQVTIGTWLGDLGIAIDKFLSQDGIDVNTAIPQLLEVLLGSGIASTAANPDGASQLQGITGSTTGSGEAPFAYVVPATVGKLLGRTSRSKPGGVLAYADLLQLLSGVQKYVGTAGSLVPGSPDPWAVFTPTAVFPMLGKFLPDIPQFTGKSFWSVLDQYVNPAVNEMYTALRVNSEGSVIPTLVLRQLPFTTELKKEDNRTLFLEVPRWVIPAAALQDLSVVRSDAMRFNFVHLMGQATAQVEANNFTAQLVRNPPIRDDQDIRRNGLRPDMQVVACGLEDAERGPKAWMDLRTDILMGQHLALSGSWSGSGIQEPICEGDNLEVDGTVFHIEQVDHVAAITPDGRKHFGTTLTLSSGMSANSNPTTDDDLYTNLNGGEFNTNDPGVTFDEGS